LWGRAEMETGQAAMWQWPRGWRMPWNIYLPTEERDNADCLGFI
jgi:hypothetical protein